MLRGVSSFARVALFFSWMERGLAQNVCTRSLFILTSTIIIIINLVCIKYPNIVKQFNQSKQFLFMFVQIFFKSTIFANNNIWAFLPYTALMPGGHHTWIRGRHTRSRGCQRMIRDHHRGSRGLQKRSRSNRRRSRGSHRRSRGPPRRCRGSHRRSRGGHRRSRSRGRHRRSRGHPRRSRGSHRNTRCHNWKSRGCLGGEGMPRRCMCHHRSSWRSKGCPEGARVTQKEQGSPQEE